MFGGTYNKKKIFITGNTGFKGSWLSSWLVKLGADVYGFSKDIPTEPSLFKLLNLENKLKGNFIGNIKDKERLHYFLDKVSPDFIFHLAAQAIVSKSYDDPIETIESNILGTANLLEYLKERNDRLNCVFITSDKCYENKEWIWGYRENDILGGKDIYSSSKACAELLIKSYMESFFKFQQKHKVVSVRAGNVIGGGDWAKDRIVVDCFKNWANGMPVTIRSPKATRPWQHVLEPLSGYLHLGAELVKNSKLNFESFNFGPRSFDERTVEKLAEDLYAQWSLKHKSKVINEPILRGNIPFEEAGLLRLNCDKANNYLNWTPNLKYQECIEFIANWYITYYSNESDICEFTNQQISYYEDLAKGRELSWTI